MAKILVIKKETERPGLQEIGDVIGIFKDEHIFSPREVAVFEILDIPNITVEEASILFRGPKRKSVWRMPEENKWMDTPPEEKTVWKDEDGKWYFLEDRPKFFCNISDLSKNDKDLLKSSKATAVVKKNALKKLKNRVKDKSTNLLRASDIPDEVE